MFDAREWLKEVEEASKLADAQIRWLQARRMMASRFGGSPTIGVHTGISDPMAQMDALMDAENEHAGTIGGAVSEVMAARKVFDGMRQIGAFEATAASMMELVHVGLSTKKAAAEALGISYASGKRAYSYGVEWLDSHGIASAKAGTGLAT